MFSSSLLGQSAGGVRPLHLRACILAAAAWLSSSWQGFRDPVVPLLVGESGDRTAQLVTGPGSS